MGLTRVNILSPNYSSRSGSAVRLIVLHTAEGALTYQSLGSYFQNPASQVSSHVGIDDTPNTVGQYVNRGDKAWTAANANPVAVQAELCAFAAWTVADWNAHPTMLQNTAQWIAEEAAAFGIPLTKLTPAQAQGSSRGICQHRDLGAWGGNHTDCGSAFPIDQVISMAQGGVPPEDEDEIEMIIVRAPNGAMSMFDGYRKVGLVSTADVSAFNAAGIKTVNISQNQYDKIPNS